MIKIKSSKLFMILGIVSTWFLIYSQIFDSKVNIGGDNAAYYILANAINNGHGYTNVHLFGTSPASHFPPGYSFIMAFFMVFNNSILFMKILNGLFLMIAAIASFKMFQKLVDTRLALVASVLILFNSHLLSYSTIMMSEISYFLVSVLILNLSYSVNLKSRPFKTWELYSLIVLSSGLFHIRTAGIALILAVFLFFIFKKKIKLSLTYFGGFILLGIPWFIRNKMLGVGGAYVNQLLSVNPYNPALGRATFEDFIHRIFNNLERYISKEIPNSLFSFINVDYKADASVVQIGMGVIILILIGFGLFKLGRQRDVLLWYVFGTFGILLLWPDVWFGVRFLTPLIPILILLLLFGIKSCIDISMQKLKIKKQFNPYIFLFAAFLFVPKIQKLSQAADANYDPRFSGYFKTAEWASTNLTDDAVVVCRKPHLFHLFSGRKVTGFARTKDQRAFSKALLKRKTTHVVVDPLGYSGTSNYLVPYIQSNPEEFKVLVKLGKPETILLSFDDINGNLAD